MGFREFDFKFRNWFSIFKILNSIFILERVKKDYNDKEKEKEVKFFSFFFIYFIKEKEDE